MVPLIRKELVDRQGWLEDSNLWIFWPGSKRAEPYCN